MKKFLLIVPIVIATLVGILGYVWWQSATEAPSAKADEVRFVISKGASAEKIGADLKQAGLIKSAFAFKLYTQINDYTRNIPPGEFQVPQNLSIEDLISHLLKGPEEYWVTIPEGLRREEIAERFVSGLGLTGVDATNFRDEFLSETRNQEGYLFPDSYLFPPDITAALAVRRLLDTFDNKTGNLNITHENIILASIIERETKTDEERPVVAGIYMNRLELGMPLQADATAQYAVANTRCSGKFECDWWVTPTRADLEINSPYNTYKNTGLPVGPIANPGITSLEAAVKPTSSDYLYYIHDDSGQIYYAETLDQHNANVQKYLR